MKTLEPKHVLRQLCTFFGSGNHTVDDACFMMMLISFDPSVYFSRFTMLLDVGPRVRVLMSSLLPCYYASGHAPHLQLISLFPPHLCRTGQQSLWGMSMAWLKSMKKSRRVSNGSEPESPLAGVNQELAGMALKRFFLGGGPWLTKILLLSMGLQCSVL